MPTAVRRLLSVVLMLFLIAIPAKPAKADSLDNAVALVVAGIAVTGALIGVGIYYAVTHNNHVTGCVSTGPDGMDLLTGDGAHYKLVGDLDAVHAGGRIKVSGKKRKIKDKQPTFLVEKLSKDYGACNTLVPAAKAAL